MRCESKNEVSEFTQAQVQLLEQQLEDIEHGKILRAKGILEVEGKKIQFNYTPFGYEAREIDSEKEQTTNAAIIGCDLKEAEIRDLFL